MYQIFKSKQLKALQPTVVPDCKPLIPYTKSMASGLVTSANVRFPNIYPIYNTSIRASPVSSPPRKPNPAYSASPHNKHPGQYMHPLQYHYILIVEKRPGHPDGCVAHNAPAVT